MKKIVLKHIRHNKVKLKIHSFSKCDNCLQRYAIWKVEKPYKYQCCLCKKRQEYEIVLCHRCKKERQFTRISLLCKTDALILINDPYLLEYYEIDNQN